MTILWIKYRLVTDATHARHATSVCDDPCRNVSVRHNSNKSGIETGDVDCDTEQLCEKRLQVTVVH